MDEQTLDEKKLTSDFNEAKFQIYRLHNIWEKCNSYACKGKLKEWNWELDRAEIELSTDMTDEDDKEESEKEDSYFMRLTKLNSEIAKNWNNPDTLYLLLKKKEKLMRHLQNSAGKGSKKRFEDEDLMD